MTFTQEDIERWLTELGQEADKSDWQEVYKFGFTMGLTAVLAKMDDARKVDSRSPGRQASGV